MTNGLTRLRHLGQTPSEPLRTARSLRVRTDPLILGIEAPGKSSQHVS